MGIALQAVNLVERRAMERLTERDSYGDVYVKQHDYITASKKLAEYEDAEEQGLLFRLPAPLNGVDSISLNEKEIWQKIPCHCKDCSHWVDGCAGCTEHVKLCDVGHYMVGENGYCLYVEQKLKEMEQEQN